MKNARCGFENESKPSIDASHECRKATLHFFRTVVRLNTQLYREIMDFYIHSAISPKVMRLAKI